MASIAEWIEKIKTAIYGEEVRGAIWQSLDAMNTQVDAINVDGAQIEQNKQDIATNTAAITALNSRITNIAQDIRNTLSAVNCIVESAYSARVGVVLFVTLRFTTTEEIKRNLLFINGLPKAFSNYRGLQNIRLYDFEGGTCFDAYVSHSDGATISGIYAVEDIPSGHQIRGTFSYIANI